MGAGVLAFSLIFVRDCLVCQHLARLVGRQGGECGRTQDGSNRLDGDIASFVEEGHEEVEYGGILFRQVNGLNM
jgi:hypothetical protein